MYKKKNIHKLFYLVKVDQKKYNKINLKLSRFVCHDI